MSRGSCWKQPAGGRRAPAKTWMPSNGPDFSEAGPLTIAPPPRRNEGRSMRRLGARAPMFASVLLLAAVAAVGTPVASAEPGLVSHYKTGTTYRTFTLVRGVK